MIARLGVSSPLTRRTLRPSFRLAARKCELALHEYDLDPSGAKEFCVTRHVGAVPMMPAKQRDCLRRGQGASSGSSQGTGGKDQNSLVWRVDGRGMGPRYSPARTSKRAERHINATRCCIAMPDSISPIGWFASLDGPARPGRVIGDPPPRSHTRAAATQYSGHPVTGYQHSGIALDNLPAWRSNVGVQLPLPRNTYEVGYSGCLRDT